MSFQIEGRTFELVEASDVHRRDGVGVELWEKLPTGESVILAELFRHDDLKKIEFWSANYETSYPLEVLELLLRTFEHSPGRTFID